jgi:hypothetical protein
MLKNNKKYIAVELPQIFDIDEYMDYIGFKPGERFDYVQENKRIVLTADQFYCVKLLDENEFESSAEVVCCHLNYIPDIWLINLLLHQIGFL